jgi:hypothetical protein
MSPVGSNPTPSASASAVLGTHSFKRTRVPEYPERSLRLSLVDVHNVAGLRLSFGAPWPNRVRRMFLPIPPLARHAGSPTLEAFDPTHIAPILRSTHGNHALWPDRDSGEIVRLARARDHNGENLVGGLSHKVRSSSAGTSSTGVLGAANALRGNSRARERWVPTRPRNRGAASGLRAGSSLWPLPAIDMRVMRAPTHAQPQVTP